MEQPLYSLQRQNRPLTNALDYMQQGEAIKAQQLQNRSANLAYQNTQAANARAQEQQQTLRQIAQANTNPDGTINRVGMVKSAYQYNPQIGMQLEKEFAPQIKQDLITGVVKKNGGNIKQTISDLQQIDPEYAMKYQKDIQSNMGTFFETKKKDFGSLAAWMETAHPEMYPAIVSMARANGYSEDEIPTAYNPEFVRNFVNTYKSQDQRSAEAKSAMDQKGFDLDTRKQQEVERDNRQNNALGWARLKSDAENTTAKTEKTDSGRPLTDTGTTAFQQAAIAAQTAVKLRDKLNEISQLKKGPISGSLLSKNPYDADLKEVENYVNMLVPSLSRGVFKEVGVLTDKDIARYKNMVATAKSDPSVAKKIMSNLMNQIDDTYKLYKKTYKAAGYNVEGFDRYNSIYDLNGGDGGGAVEAPQKIGRFTVEVE